MPGSNWHTYLFDPDGHSNELYYGIEQIGWNGHSKPRSMYNIGFEEAPPLPQISEFQETQNALAKGVDLQSGFRHVEQSAETYDVDGVLLPRPFKIVRLGPVYLFVDHIESAESFYRDTLGFTLTEEVLWHGHRCLFFRCNTDHHSLALFPLELREVLGMSPHSTSAALGLAARQLSPAPGCGEIFSPTGGRRDRIAPAGTSPRHRILCHRARSRRAYDPTLLRYGANRLAGPISIQRIAKAAKTERMARGFGSRSECVYLGEPYLGPWG